MIRASLHATSDISRNLEEELDFVGTAHTAREAQHLIKLTKPELLFLDIELPNKDAFALLGEIEDKQYNPVVIFPPVMMNICNMPSVQQPSITCSNLSM